MLGRRSHLAMPRARGHDANSARCGGAAFPCCCGRGRRASAARSGAAEMLARCSCTSCHTGLMLGAKALMLLVAAACWCCSRRWRCLPLRLGYGHALGVPNFAYFVWLLASPPSLVSRWTIRCFLQIGWQLMNGDLVVSRFSIKGFSAAVCMCMQLRRRNGENTQAGKKKGQACTCGDVETAKPQKKWQNDFSYA